jgi:hypothetical protein
VHTPESSNRDNSPLDYTKKADYGKRPAYLDEVAREIEEEQNYIKVCLCCVKKELYWYWNRYMQTTINRK